LLRCVAHFLGGNVMLAGLLVSWLCFTALLVLLYQLVADDHGDSKARTTLLLLCVFPTVSFLLGVYTESLYLALVVGCFLAASRHRYGFAAVLGLLAGFTRMQGVVLAAPLAFQAVTEWRAGRRSLQPWLAALSPLLAIAAFQWYTHLVTRGVAVAAVYNRVWQQHFAPPWDVIATYWSAIAANHFQLFTHSTGNWLDALNLVLALGMLAILLPARRIVGTPLWLYGLLTWVMAMSLHQSTARYMLTVFPALIVAAVRWPELRLRRLALFLGAPLMLFMAGEFVLWSFIG
jgi:Gpi18-like mannosyltransferase